MGGLMGTGVRRVVAGAVATAVVVTAGTVLLPLDPPVAHAATVTFTVTQGDYVAEPPIGPCATVEGECSLRGALLEAQLRMAAGDDVVIEFADSLDGAVFQPAPGLPGAANPAMYHVDVPAGRSLTIGSSNARPRLDGGDANRVFEFSGTGSVTLRNLAIDNGRTNDDPGAAGRDGAGIRTTAAVTLDDVSMDGNMAQGGGSGAAIHSTNDVTLINSSISNSLGTGNGAALFVDGGSADVLLQRSVLTNNRHGLGGYGGAIYCVCSSVTVEAGSTLDRNHARLGGGGIYAESAAVSITDSTIVGNTMFNGAGGP